jgi:hypothetical protein
MFIPVLGSDLFHPGSRVRKIPEVFLTPINKFLSSLKNYMDAHTSRIRIFFYPGSRGLKSTRSRIRIRNTGKISV